MTITAEERASRSLRMKEQWQKKKAAAGELPTDPAVRDAMAKVPMNAVVSSTSELTSTTIPAPVMTGSFIKEYHIDVQVDWEHIPIPDGQQFYAHLKYEFERAGRILNSRSMERISGYTCFMCKKHFNGNPGFTDFSYTDPETGLSPRIDCCGELCVINYNALRINQRHQRDVARAQQERNG